MPTYPFERERHWLDAQTVELPQAPLAASPHQRQPSAEAGPTVVEATIDRRTLILDKVKRALQDLSGIPDDAFDDDATSSSWASIRCCSRAQTWPSGASSV